MVPVSARLRELSEYRRIAAIDEIGRRYLAMNAFDGILTMIGMVMGSYLAGIEDASIVLYTGLSTAMAMGVSGFWGAYMTESAERKRNMQELEQAMLVDLSNTKQARAARFAAVVVSLIDGLSPLLAGLIVMTPFMFSGLVSNAMVSFGASLGVSLVMLFVLGVFLAKIAEENIVRSGIKMIFAGLVCVGLSFLLNGHG